MPTITIIPPQFCQQQKTLCWFPAKYFKLLQISKKLSIKDHTILSLIATKNFHPKEEGSWLGFTMFSINLKNAGNKKRIKRALFFYFLLSWICQTTWFLFGPHSCQDPPFHLIFLSFSSQFNHNNHNHNRNLIMMIMTKLLVASQWESARCFESEATQLRAALAKYYLKLCLSFA